MDSPGFTDWVQWWYEEVKKVSNGPWPLIMENFSSHDSLPALDNVKYVLLPEKITATYQPLDQEIISKSKIKYLSKDASRNNRHCPRNAGGKPGSNPIHRMDDGDFSKDKFRTWLTR